MALNSSPTYSLTPSASQVTLPTNYITSFDFTNQYLPDTEAQEIERYGNRSIASFLQMVSAEIPSDSDLIKWSEQGRLHTKYTGVTANTAFASGVETFTLAGGATCNFRANQTVLISDEASSVSKKAVITTVGVGGVDEFTAAYYTTEASSPFTGTVTVFAYGSEFAKGSPGMQDALESESSFFEVKPIIIKEMYEVSGSDMAQIGWVHISGENGAPGGYLWYLKSEHDTRTRFNDYLEMSMVEGVEAVASSAAETFLGGGSSGTEGLFSAISSGGNVWSGGNPTAIADWDTVLKRMDKQGAIKENVLFVNRDMAIDIDDMLAAQNSYGAGGTSYGMFDNSEDMALNLGFDGFKRGSYEFYKTDWKYLNEITLRGGLTGGNINGVLVPAGTTSVYDQVMGQNIKRPFLHCRYRKSQTEDRRYKSWVLGSAGGAATTDIDKMQVNFLSERALCTMGRNNFFLFQD